MSWWVTRYRALQISRIQGMRLGTKTKLERKFQEAVNALRNQNMWSKKLKTSCVNRVIAAFAGLVFAVQSFANELPKLSLEQLVSRSDVVVIGTVMSFQRGSDSS